MHHGFTREPRDDDPEGLFVTEAALRSQVDYLLRHRWTPLDLTGYLNVLDGAHRPGRAFLLTVDDGYVSFADIAAPILAQSGVPSVLFVPSGRIGRTASWLPEPAEEPLLDAVALRHLAAAGVEIGAHGNDHRPLRGLDDAEMRRQCVEVREALADVTGRLPRVFAYPYGVFDQRARMAVAAAGYEAAFSVHDDAGRFAISRVDVNASDDLGTFRLKLVPGYRRLWRLAGHLGPMRRTVRRAVSRRGCRG